MRIWLSAFLVPLTLIISNCGQNSPPPQQEADAGANVEGLTTMVTGSVEIQKPGGAWQALAPKDGVPSGSKLRTGADGEADVLLAEQSAVRLKPGTEMEITSNRAVNGAVKIDVRVDVGRLLHRFDKMPPGSEYRMTTPTAVAGIRGTQFELTSSALQTGIRVLRGQVDVENSVGKVQVGAKQGTLVRRGEAPAAPENLPQKDVDSLFECSIVHFDVALQKARRVVTTAEMRNVSVPLEVWAAQHDGLYPKTLAEGGADGVKDAWGGAYRYEATDGGKGFVITSDGPDKKPDTEDDLEYRR